MTTTIPIGDILGDDIAAPGIHRRLLAGLLSLTERADEPEILEVRPGGAGHRAYDDEDLVAIITVGDAATPGRSVTGTIEAPLHVSCGGRVTPYGHYTAPRLDLTVIGAQTTRFVGEIPPDTMGEVAEAVRDHVERQLARAALAMVAGHAVNVRRGRPTTEPRPAKPARPAYDPSDPPDWERELLANRLT